jgi:hypothetical protein
MNQYPSKQWCLYIKDDEPNHQFNGSIVKQEQEIDEDNMLVSIQEWLGFRKEMDLEKFIGEKVIVKKSQLKVSYLTSEHINILVNRVTENKSRYFKDDNSIHYLYNIVGYYKTIVAITENGGVITDELVEKLIETIQQPFYIRNSRVTTITINSFFTEENKHLMKTLTPIEALKKFGLKLLDDIIERTMYFFETDGLSGEVII